MDNYDKENKKFLIAMKKKGRDQYADMITSFASSKAIAEASHIMTTTDQYDGELNIRVYIYNQLIHESYNTFDDQNLEQLDTLFVPMFIKNFNDSPRIKYYRITRDFTKESDPQRITETINKIINNDTTKNMLTTAYVIDNEPYLYCNWRRFNEYEESLK